MYILDLFKTRKDGLLVCSPISKAKPLHCSSPCLQPQGVLSGLFTGRIGRTLRGISSSLSGVTHAFGRSAGGLSRCQPWEQ